MQIHHADRPLPQSSWGCGRSCDAEAQITLRRKALLEVAAAAAEPTPAVSLESKNTTTGTIRPVAGTDTGTYDLAAMRRQKGSLSILTQDGDTVQIRFRTREGVALQSGTVETAEGSTSTTSAYAFASGRVRVEVNGELDADELKAIGELMDKVDSLATQFFDGDAQAAFSAAAGLGFDSGEIAGFALRLSVKEYARATVQAPAIAPPASSASQTTADLPAAADAPAAAPPSPEPVVIAAAPAPVAPASEAVATAAEPPAPVEAAPSLPVADPLAALQESLGSFLKQVLEGLSSVGGTGRAEFSMHWKLQIMIQAVQSAPAEVTSDPAGTQLATESLGELAAAQR